MREITWKEHLLGWWWLYLFVFFLLVVSVLAALMIPRAEIGFLVILFTVIVCAALCRLIVAHKKSIKMHSCGKFWYNVGCPNCGDICHYCGKKAKE